MKRLCRWLTGLWQGKPSVVERKIDWLTDDASEPIEPAKPPVRPGPLTDITVAYERMIKSDPGLAQFAQELNDKVVEYPPKRDQSTQDWITERLQSLTGGMTRHPADLTQYPTPPSEADLAARDYYGQSNIPRGLFTHGYSMDYLNALLRRADQRDSTLTAEELMSLRARGLA